MTISKMTEALLKAHAGRGFSSDPALTTRHKARLLQHTSKLPKHGQGVPGLWILPDEAQTCTSKLRVIAGYVYSILVERTTSDRWVEDHQVLPPDAEKDGYGWRLPNKNVIEKEARLVGVFGGIDAELDLAKTAMKVARAFNSDAKARATRFNVPIFGLAYELGCRSSSTIEGNRTSAQRLNLSERSESRKVPARRKSSARARCTTLSRAPSPRRSGRPRIGEAQSCRPAPLRRDLLSAAAPQRSEPSKRRRRSQTRTKISHFDEEEAARG